MCRILEDCLFLHLESSGWLGVAAAQHIAYILAWALVGKTYAGFVLACRYTANRALSKQLRKVEWLGWLHTWKITVTQILVSTCTVQSVTVHL